MATVSLRNISKNFNGLEVIKGMTLDIEDRELAVIVGPSGCGKSTLLRLIAGLEEVTSGEILIDGEMVNDLPPTKRGLAMVFQSYALYPHMSVADNMGFSLRLAGAPKEERSKKVLEAARILQIESLLEHKPRELSGGQRQRVAIGRAIVRNPRVFLFDEPLSNLDAALRAQMRIEILRLHEELNATMIYVTHDQVEAMTMADKIVILRGGTVEQVGSPLELYHHPHNLFVAGFLGSPQMNFVHSTVREIGEAVITVSLPAGAFVDVPAKSEYLTQGDEVCLGVRPEHLAVDNGGQLPGIVRFVERLGGTTFLHVQIEGGQELILEVGGDDPIRAQDYIRIMVNGDTCHLFNKAGEAIPRAGRNPLADVKRPTRLSRDR
jgi:multiple sugar transport system ATP-binding protein